MWIVIDGPEKAGKTTTAKALVAHAETGGMTAKYRHFSGDDPATEDCLAEVLDDQDQYGLVVWDRSWASGQVYGDLGFAQRTEAVRAEGEQIFAGARPLKIMLLGPSAEVLQSKRTPDDLPVAASIEREAFQRYAREHGWSVMQNDHTGEDLEMLLDWLLIQGRMQERGLTLG